MILKFIIATTIIEIHEKFISIKRTISYEISQYQIRDQQQTYLCIISVSLLSISGTQHFTFSYKGFAIKNVGQVNDCG